VLQGWRLVGAVGTAAVQPQIGTQRILKSFAGLGGVAGREEQAIARPRIHRCRSVGGDAAHEHLAWRLGPTHESSAAGGHPPALIPRTALVADQPACTRARDSAMPFLSSSTSKGEEPQGVGVELKLEGQGSIATSSVLFFKEPGTSPVPSQN